MDDQNLSLVNKTSIGAVGGGQGSLEIEIPNKIKKNPNISEVYAKTHSS